MASVAILDPASPPVMTTVRRVQASRSPATCYRNRSNGSRLAGMIVAVLVHLGVAGVLLLRFDGIPTAPASRAPLVVNLLPLATPPAPVHDRPPGPLRVERKQAAAPVIPAEPLPMPMPIVETRPQPAERTPPAPPPAPVVRVAATASAPVVPPAPPAPTAGAREPDFAARLLLHIERFRRYPAAARRMGVQGVTHVRLTMERSGYITALAVARSSGSSALDRAALNTLRRATPLPQIPADRPGRLEVVIPVEFILEQEKHP